jgi:DNA-binding response OmpR family regulator
MGLFRNIEVALRQHLRKQGGVGVSKAADSDHFVRRATTEKCVLLIVAGQTLLPGTSDTGLPLENAMRVIRAVKAKSSAPVIALSTITKTEQELLSAGADVFLAIPFKMKQFTDAVDRCLPPMNPPRLSGSRFGCESKPENEAANLARP